MADDLKVKMGVDIDGVLQGMKRAEKSLGDFKDQAARFKAALDKATDPASIIRLNKAIEATEKRIKAISSVGTSKPFDNFTKGSNQAGQALTNLGRVAQDVPFGFVGIQNNLNPLLESFQQLKKETGSTGGALKALVSSLSGAGGIGLALSLTTAIVTFATNGFGAWTRGLTGNKKAIDDNKDSIKEMQQAYDSIISSLTQEQVKIDKIVVALENENLTRKQRINAIEQLQKAAPAYFSTLDKENATIGQITQAYNKFSQSIIRSIEARVREKELLNITEQILKLRDKATKIGTDEVVINGKIVKVSQQNYDLNSKTLTAQEAYNATLRGTIGLTSDENKELTKLEATRARLLALIVEASGADPFKEIDKAEKAKKKVETVTDVIAELSREIDFLNAKSIAFGTNEAKAKIAAIQSAAEKLIKDFKVAPDDALINKLFFGGTIFNPINGFNIPGIEGLTEKLQEAVKRSVPTTPTEISVPVNLKLVMEKNREKIEGAINPFLKDITEEANAIGESMAEEMAAGFGENLGKALAGQGGLGNLFAGIFQSLGNSLSQLGDIFIKTAIQVKIFKDLLLSNPTLALIAGIGLKALGSLIKSTIKVPGFADGVTSFRGGLAIVGERGPELVRLPTGSDVIPNHSLGSAAIGGGQAIEVIVRGEISGQNILLAGSRAQRSLNRVG